MEKHQTVSENKEDTANALKQKTNQDFNDKKPAPNDPGFKKETPETEVPGIGDDKKTNPGVITSEDESSDTLDEKSEAPTEGDSLEPVTDLRTEDESDSAAAGNSKDSNIF